MKDVIPYVIPSEILKFFNLHAINQIDFSKVKRGASVPLTYPTIEDYFGTIPEKLRNDPKYSSEYHNALLRMTQLLVNEGLLTPEGNASGFYQRYRGNGYDANLATYGYYDFRIFGFPVIRHNFEETVRPVILNQGDKDKKESIGTGFTVRYDRTLSFVTARHCLPHGDLITIPMFVPPMKPLIPINIYVPENENIDLAILETSEMEIISDKWFFLEKPEILDEVLTMGYPPIPGFTEAVQVAETARISTSMKSTTGQITGQGIHYHGGMKDHFLISARVKGGNSGGPVINRSGRVVGMIIESLQNDSADDLLGYGVSLSSTVIDDLILSISGKEQKMAFKKLQFESNQKGFVLI